MLLRKLSAGLLLALLAGALLGSSAVPDCSPIYVFQFDLENAERQFMPQWTPDGALLVYVSGGKIYSVKPDGTGERLISTASGDYDGEYDYDASPNISPDGSQIVYATYRDSGRFLNSQWSFDIATARIDGSQRRLLTGDNVTDANPVWSPDGRRIAWVSWDSVMVMEADGSQPRAVAPGVAAMEFPPRWSPDGQHIAFIRDERERVEGTDKEYSSPLYVASLDGQVQQVAEVSATPSVAPPAWSPDEQRLAFVKPVGIGRKALYTIAPDGAQPQEVMRLASTRPQVGNLSWSPDGSEIMLNYGGRLAAVNRHGTALQRFELDVYDPAASWSPDGTQIAVFRKDDASLSIIASARREPPVYFRPSKATDRGYLGGYDPADCPSDEFTPRLERDCRALLRIGAALSAIPPLDWNPHKPIYGWEGIRIGGPHAVVEINLQWRDLTGVIPPELGQLAELEVLDLGDNWLTGEIPPELGRLKNLEYLNLSRNFLTGKIPGELGRIDSLQEMFLHNNYLNGEAPPELSDMASLEILTLRYNNLTGAPRQNSAE